MGKSGLLGSCFLKHLAGDEDFELFAFDRSGLDVGDEVAMAEVFKRISPDFVINCTAYTAVDKAEQNIDEAFKINATAVGLLAKFCKQENARLIHFSTEYIFDGSNPSGYSEDAISKPINVYGKSKAAGEKLIQETMSDYYIIRTSWLYGEHGPNFVDTIVKLLRERDSLSVVTDQIGSPTYAVDLCQGVIDQFLGPWLNLLPKHHEHQLPEDIHSTMALPFGIYHLTNDGTVSRYDWVKRVAELLSLTPELKPVDSTVFPTLALRPQYSTLRNTKARKLRPWHEALKAYIDLHF